MKAAASSGVLEPRRNPPTRLLTRAAQTLAHGLADTYRFAATGRFADTYRFAPTGRIAVTAPFADADRAATVRERTPADFSRRLVQPDTRDARFLKPLALAALALSLAQAQPPILDSLRPRSARPGQTVRIAVEGQFSGPEAVVVPSLPASFETLAGSLSTRRLFLATIQPDAVAGLYRFQLRTPAGISNALFFSIGAGPQIKEDESEPDAAARLNDRPEDAQRVRQTPAIVHGTLTPGDRDYYTVYAKGTEKRTFELEGRRLGLPETLSLRILTLHGEPLARVEGAGALDRRVTVRFPAEGLYLVEIDASGRAAGELYYRLRMAAPREKIP